MAQLSARSLRALGTCDSRIADVLFDVIEVFDFTVLEGHRDKESQNAAYARGASKVTWPNSKHNTVPSRAVDIAPYPIDWSNKETARQRFCLLAGYILMAAHRRGIALRWGGDWNMNDDTRDEPSFRDYPHFELVDP